MSNEKIPLLDLQLQNEPLMEQIREAIDRVLSSQRFIMGPEILSLEEKLAKYVSSGYGIGVSSGSDALILALMGLGVGPGDEVITTPHTFFATVGAISRLGALPVFVDIEPKSFNIDVAQIEEKITPKTKAIIPVHLFGQSTEMQDLLSLCSKREIAIIEDAAQAIGTEYQGKRVGSLGKVGCFSFFPSKNLGAMGDGGLVVTNDKELGEKMRSLRSHGSKPKYYHQWIGGNFRLDALQAAIVNVKFEQLDHWTKLRQENAHRYDELIESMNLKEWIIPPWRRKGDRHIFNQYVIRSKRRDALRAHLGDSGIGTEIYYPVPMHLQECFSYLGHKKGDFPEAEKAAADSLAIPIYPGLLASQQERVMNTIQRFYS